MDDKKKILILEDDDLIRNLFVDVLKQSGYDVDSVALGNDVFAAAESKSYDLFLLDILLPDTNGLDVLKQLRATPKTRSTKVVMLTNLGQDTVIASAFQLGANGFLIKSAYNPDQVVAEVAKYLSAPEVVAS